MPTGFTSEIEKGITFPQFALRCAKAFGTLIDMRDDSLDKPIPATMEPGSYHREELKKAKEKLEKAKKIPLKEAKKIAKREYENAIKYNQEEIKIKKNLKTKYEEMLNQVVKWQPPTPQHTRLKDFMYEQISDSIKFDCNTEYYEKQVNLLTPKQYVEQEIKSCKDDIKYHLKHYQEEVKRCADNTKWVQDLRKSLNL